MYYRKSLTFLKNLGSCYLADKIPTLSAALAYYTLFSIGPILLVAISTVGLVLGKDTVKNQIITEISSGLGKDTANLIQGIIDTITKPVEGTIANISGIVLLIIGSSGIFSEIQNGLNTIWGVKKNPNRHWSTAIKDRFFSFTIVLGISFLFLIFMVFSMIMATLNEYLMPYLGATFLDYLNTTYLISFFIIVLLFGLMFKVLPDVYLQWKDVWLGAFITALLYSVGKFLLGKYLQHSSVASLYGASTSLIVLLIWVYYSAQTFFIGAEITKVFALKKKKPIIRKPGISKEKA